MGVVRNTLIISALVTGPAVVAPPALYVEPNPQQRARLEQRSLTQMGVAGQHLFVENCLVCHGEEGRGTSLGPSLHHDIYKPGALSRRAFHRAVTEGVTAQRWSFGDMPASDALSFNEIELIARYVREIQFPARFN